MGSVIYNSKCTRKRLSVGVRPDPLDDSGTCNAVRDLLAKRRPEKGKEIEGEKERERGKEGWKRDKIPYQHVSFPLPVPALCIIGSDPATEKSNPTHMTCHLKHCFSCLI